MNIYTHRWWIWILDIIYGQSCLATNGVAQSTYNMQLLQTKYCTAMSLSPAMANNNINGVAQHTRTCSYWLLQ